MERQCEFPSCPKTLSELVPPDICYCGNHQQELIILRIELEPEELPEADIIFIFHHPDGCSPKELADHLKIPYQTIIYYINRKKIKSKLHQRHHHIIIPQIEIIRVISLERNWTIAIGLAKAIGAEETSFYKYSKQGHFGPTELTLQGYLALDIYWNDNLSILKKRFERIRNNRRNPKKILNSAQKSVPFTTIACFCNISHQAVSYWIESYNIPYQKKGQLRTVTGKDFKDFLIKVNRGETRLKPKTIERLKALLASEAFNS